jgi:hypothetical protein
MSKIIKTGQTPNPLGRLMSARLMAVDKGIDIGIQKDLANSAGGLVNTVFGTYFELLSSMLTFTLPSRGLERKVKNESALQLNNTKINEQSKLAFQKYIIVPSINLYNSNFKKFIDLVDDHARTTPPLFVIPPRPSTTDVDVLSTEYVSADVDVTTLSRESPYKIILSRLIPFLRSKFNAITTFKETVGAGSRIDYQNIGDRFAAGTQTPDDINQLQDLYQAITDWNLSLLILREGGSRRSRATTTTTTTTTPPGAPTFPQIIAATRIDRIEEVQNIPMNHSDPLRFDVDQATITLTNPPILRIILSGPHSGYIAAVGTPEDYFDHYYNSNEIVLPRASRWRDYITDITSTTIRGGAALDVTFDYNAVSRLPQGTPLMEVYIDTGHQFDIFADDKSMLDDLIKISSISSTTPFYEGTSPGGERVSFTPADLVIGGGKIRDSKGKSFKPTKISGKSLSKRVVSPNFGKVKRGLKSKKKK